MNLGLWGSISPKTILGAIARGGGGPSDTTKPTVTITSTESSPSFVNPIPLTFTLSEVSTDFAVGDITVGAGGSIGNFAGSGTDYTADLTVTSAGATVTVDVAADAFTDAAGNGNTAATQFSITSGLQLLDKFTADDAAPVNSPRTAEPGPGTLVVIDTGNRTSISSGVLSFSGNASGTDPLVGTQSNYARALGLALFQAIKNAGASDCGWEDTQNGRATRNSIVMGGTTAACYNNDSGLDSVITGLVANSVYSCAIVLRAAGAWYFIKGGVYATWTLAYVDTVCTTTPLYATFSLGTNAACTLDDFIIAQLPAPYNNEYGFATSHVASASVGETATMEADAVVEFTWTFVTGQTLNLMVRRVDDDNTWSVRADGSTIKLIEINASVETERNSVAQVMTNGVPYRIVVYCFGNTIKTSIANAMKNSYTSATFQNTATGVKVDRAGAHLTAWPRTLSGTALTVLSAANP